MIHYFVSGKVGAGPDPSSQHSSQLLVTTYYNQLVGFERGVNSLGSGKDSLRFPATHMYIV